MTTPLLIQGDARHIPLADASVQCVVTSPPYYGLRDYGTGEWVGGDPGCPHSRRTSLKEATITTDSRPTNTNHEQEGWKGGRCGHCGATRIDAQIGLEDTLEAYIAGLVAVFREVKRVLRPDGTLWLNIGDSYAGSWGNYGGQNRGNGTQRPITTGSLAPQPSYDGLESWRPPTASSTLGIPPKNLCMVPARLTLALQADGWILRSEIVWAKKNCMPESVQDRPTRSHEMVYLLSKSPHYFYDGDAIREAPVSQGLPSAESLRGKGWHDHSRDLEAGQHFDGKSTTRKAVPLAGRNARSVWSIATEGFPGGHFATFPTELVRRCLLAGTSSHGCCAACGSPWQRVTERATHGKLDYDGKYREQSTHGAGRNMLASMHAARAAGAPHDNPFRPPVTLGWEPTCACQAAVKPCTVLDPFVGSGTTLLVARELGRQGIGVDLSAPYLHQIARQRLGLDALHAWTHGAQAQGERFDDLPLFVS